MVPHQAFGHWRAADILGTNEEHPGFSLDQGQRLAFLNPLLSRMTGLLYHQKYQVQFIAADYLHVSNMTYCNKFATNNLSSPNKYNNSRCTAASRHNQALPTVVDILLDQLVLPDVISGTNRTRAATQPKPNKPLRRGATIHHHRSLHPALGFS